jgi:D-alanyl-D-alanine carboxypeptidase/D-alanyl-D-alanine-endopeptidase (penicillin-binding protein 4)
MNLNLAVPNPSLYTNEVITAALHKYGISLNGQIITGKTSSTAIEILASHSSAPLTVLITTMLKNSDDLYAEALTKTLGVKKYAIGSDKAGVAAIQDYLSSYNLPNYVIENGSGSSRYNLASPEVLGQLMYHANQDKWLAAALIQALPISGVDGTLNTFPSQILKGKVYAKTGTMAHVANLTGYLSTKSGKQVIFSLLIDDTPLPDSALHPIQADLLETVYQDL